MQDIIATLKRLLDDVVEELPPLDAGSDLIEDVGLSSIDVMELVSLVEDEWDLAFPLNDLAEIRTLEALAARIQQLLDSRS